MILDTERFFKSNWKESQVTLFSNATIVSCSSAKSSETVIQMAKQTTLIIFGKQLKDVPKKPMLPPGYRIDQLLAIGLIHTTSQKGIHNGLERMTIIFHWFLPLSIHDLVDWIIAINNSIPDNKQILTDDDLTMSLVTAEAAHYNQMMMLQQQQTLSALEAGESLVCPQLEINTVFRYRSGHHNGTGDGVNYAGLSDLDHVHIGGFDDGTFDDYFNDAGADMAFDCGGDIDNCTAFAASDAFAIF